MDLEFAVQEPAPAAPILKDPELLTGAGFDTPIVATDGAATPPPRFNPLRPPVTSDVVAGVGQLEVGEGGVR